ncbi:hypothetical protein SAMN05421630_101130 [Prauserella marina]|uniref:Uncharacterized protein n=1 Tax=Prauserella marina TaxID=530584 RepID=A0A1G6I8V3_9PSEU|nr:hypothetical protein DES30_1011208 [Prauserella marina]SDC02868.1 hypothetical protein SAMN05421630_101130 [Prauserella marina]
MTPDRLGKTRHGKLYSGPPLERVAMRDRWTAESGADA